MNESNANMDISMPQTNRDDLLPFSLCSRAQYVQPYFPHAMQLPSSQQIEICP